MTEGLILDLLRETLWVTLVVSTPVLATALVVGVAIGLVQALTSVQEMTLTFVPKVAAIAVVFWISMGATGTILVEFYQRRILDLIAGG
ncbi:MAG: flagellar biosynthetic protein FliQ [Rhodobacterales bacterium CG18_big_fil_WC_8_21_14_2_50_71_9]|nr:flagellar biosynthetic protein FliQ [Alphaproteobacteria bacterium]PIP97308.1 MAG: flagellar biosynthetic protein FliQ [Rhodobacterales bacterium CG18_big_fil_WC_8_21_14_2_50_71_9]PIY73688.1 MAG: flagellar biosynthetic protein FliQ [Rhodobacterales bacterium CG_4_10_14_0_8_um_filter_70_9]